MTRSATDVMHDVIAAAVIDAIEALKAGARGVPNSLLRDLNAIHANTGFNDLPADLQAAIGASVRAAFTRLLKEGYAVAPKTAQPPVRNPGSDRPRRTGGDRRPPPKGPGGDRPGARRPRPPHPKPGPKKS